MHLHACLCWLHEVTLTAGRMMFPVAGLLWLVSLCPTLVQLDTVDWDELA